MAALPPLAAPGSKPVVRTISSKGFMLILTLAMSTPVPSDFTRTFTL